jgi:uncharacterized membrane protein YhaH (DUF805 family)
MSDELNNGQAPGQPGQNYNNPYYSGGQEKMTGIVDAYKAYWLNYVNFNDRTSRAGYWWVILINYIINIVLFAALIGPAMASVMVAFTNPLYAASAISSIFAGAGAIFLIWELANTLPGLAICVRRLHDTGKSWLYILFNLIPVIGGIIFIVFMATGTKYPPENRFYNLPKKG